MKRIIVILFLVIFLLPHNSFAEDESDKRVGFVALLMPVLVEAGKIFIDKFMTKTSDKVISKVFDESVAKAEKPSGLPEKSGTEETAQDNVQSETSSSSSEQKNVNLALLTKVWQLNGEAVQTVDPSKTVFKSGDLIYLEVAVTSPGVIEAYNKTPSGKMEKIGNWNVSSVGSVRIPKEDNNYIEFYDEAGDDILEVRFYPCMTGSGQRSLRVKNVTGIKADIAAQLPICQSRYSDSSANGENKVRSLRIKEGTAGVAGYAIKSYAVEKGAFSEPIVSSLQLRSQ
jgi:hypothetical protein